MIGTRNLWGVAPDARVRNATQTASCTQCGGRLDCTIAPLWAQRYPGEVVIRCTGCGVRETPAMRAAWEAEQAKVREALTFLPCKVCGTRFEVKTWSRGKRDEYCSLACRYKRKNDNRRKKYAQKAKRRRALEAAQKAKRRERAA